MADDSDTIICDFCKQGKVALKLEEMTFRQWSDRGYVHCRVEILMGTCDACGSKSLGPGSEQVFDAAFQKEYDRLR